MTTRDFKNVIRLSQEQYLLLKTAGSIVVEGQTITYSPLDTIYLVTGASPIDVQNTTEGVANDVQLTLSNNVLSAQLNSSLKATLLAKQDALTTGNGINIVSNVVSNTSVLTGTSAPTSSTTGYIGQFYLDTTNVKLYQCTAAGNIWNEVGGGSETQLYRHQFIAGNVKFNIITNSSTPFTTSTLAKWLYDNGFTTSSYPYTSGIGGNLVDSGTVNYFGRCMGIFSSNGTSLFYVTEQISFTINTSNAIVVKEARYTTTIASISDIVIAL